MPQYEKEKLLTIARPGRVCALCGESIEHEPKHLSVLTEGDAQAPRAEPAPTDGAETETDAEAPQQEASDANGAAAAGDDDAPFQRMDYHRACWKKAQKEDYLSFWLAKRPEPAPTPKLTKKERAVLLLGLFQSVMQTSNPADDPLRFVLAHLLMRYRILTLCPPRIDDQGRKWIVFELPKEEERYEAPDILLGDRQMAETMARIEQYLDRATPEEAAASDEAKN